MVVSCLASRTGKRCGLSADTVSLGQADQQCRRTIACMRAPATTHALSAFAVLDWTALLERRTAGGKKDSWLIDYEATKRRTAGGKKDSWLIDYEATKNCLDVGRETGASHFVLLSAICVQKPLLEFQRAKLKLEADLQVTGVWRGGLFGAMMGHLSTKHQARSHQQEAKVQAEPACAHSLLYASLVGWWPEFVVHTSVCPPDQRCMHPPIHPCALSVHIELLCKSECALGALFTLVLPPPHNMTRPLATSPTPSCAPPPSSSLWRGRLSWSSRASRTSCLVTASWRRASRSARPTWRPSLQTAWCRRTRCMDVLEE